MVFRYSGAVNWEFAPDYGLSLVGSHQERLPLAQSCMPMVNILQPILMNVGNQNLEVEKSNNLELGLHYEGDKLRLSRACISQLV